MHTKNRLNSNKFIISTSYQSLYLTENIELLNPNFHIPTDTATLILAIARKGIAIERGYNIELLK